jgi:hypothetical protein
MPSPVAVVGDVSATAGTLPFTAADSGTWTPGSISYTSYPTLRSGGAAVIWKATCTFTFSGQNSGGGKVEGSETVTLEAASRTIQPGHFVLVDGDREESGYQNVLAVSAAGPLRTE